MKRATTEPPVLPGYDYVQLLGSGGFSDVFLYEQKLPKRRVAVKVLLVDEELTAANRAAFVAEANLMAQLSAHPYIVTIYHADVAGDDRPYFVMEYCSGPSLAERYKQSPLSVVDALRTGVRLSSAVATAHGAGILHRDIKPGNVLSNDYGWPALTDFGISSALDDEVLPVHTSTFSRSEAAAGGTTGTGQSIGLSVPWSPPEMFEDDPDPDVRADVFSLAATIWTVLAGQTPFEVRGRSNGTLDLIGRIERGAITPMARDDVPRSLTAVLQKGMSTKREDRFATAIDFGRALQRVELELGYARTELEVPNLHLEAQAPREVTGAEDETRVRTVATIDAQPVSASVAQPVAPSGPPADDHPTRMRDVPVIRQPEPDAGDATIIRPRQQPVAEPTLAPGAIGAPDDPEPPRRNRVALIVIVAVALLVVAAVVVGIALFGGVDTADPDATNSPDPTGAVIPKVIPTPVLIGVPVEGTDDAGSPVVNFTVSNPDPEDGDGFIYQQTSPPEQGRHRVDEDVVTVPYTPGIAVCVDVLILRDAKTSPEALSACYPTP